MKNIKTCLKCKKIITFCECDKPITDKDEYIEYLESKVLSYESYKKNIDEALNSGDGTYRP